MAGKSRGEEQANLSWLLPLWLAFPGVTPEMYPRPHPWNAYGKEWEKWYWSLSPVERQSYEEAFPEPPEWKSFYQFVRNGG